MRKNKHREILRALANGLSFRTICPLLEVSYSTVSRWCSISRETGLNFNDLQNESDAELKMLFKPESKKHMDPDPRKEDLMKEMPFIIKELSKRYATKESVYETYYRVKYPNGYKLTQFKKYVREFMSKQEPAYHIAHTPGEEWQVDFAGDKLYLTDRLTKDKTPLDVLIAVMPYSNLPFMYAMPKATVDYFYDALNKGLEYMGAVPQCIRSDNMKQWVTKPDRYCPTFSQFNLEWTQYYGIEPVACRVRRPSDKGSVERAVQLMYDYIYARIEGMEFHDIKSLNERILELLDEYCDRPFKGSTRRDLFNEYERPNMIPLPQHMYRMRRRKVVKLGRNYHIQVEDHSYSAPYEYIGRELTVYWDVESVDIYCGGDWICSHEKSLVKNGFTTVDAHMPERHLAFKREKGMNAAAYIEYAGRIGPSIEWLVKSMLNRPKYPQVAYRGCAGVLHLAKVHGNERVEEAGTFIEASHLHPDYQTLKTVIVNDLDKKSPMNASTGNNHLPVNTNVRGKDAFLSIQPLSSKTDKGNQNKGKGNNSNQDKKRKDDDELQLQPQT